MKVKPYCEVPEADRMKSSDFEEAMKAFRAERGIEAAPPIDLDAFAEDGVWAPDPEPE